MLYSVVHAHISTELAAVLLLTDYTNTARSADDPTPDINFPSLFCTQIQLDSQSNDLHIHGVVYNFIGQ